MFPFADITDVQDAYEGGALPADATARVTYLLQVANAKLAALIPALPGWIAANLVDDTLARDVVVRAVLGAFRNPTGAASMSEAAGPFNTNMSGLPAAFTPEDLALLYPRTARSREPIRMRPPRHCRDGYGWRHPL